MKKEPQLFKQGVPQLFQNMGIGPLSGPGGLLHAIENDIAQAKRIGGFPTGVAYDAPPPPKTNLLQYAGMIPLAGDVLGPIGDIQFFAENPDEITPQNLSLAALGALPFVPGITAYHGSPHLFDKFDIGKLGTGEGSQIFGHGLYVAESPEVAKQYAETVGSLKNQSTNYLYTVDLPDKYVEKMLDLDAPFKKQSTFIRKVFEKDFQMDPDITGQELYEGLLSELRNDPVKVADFLSEMGITGTKYFDALSRGKGKGTKNFAVFDDKILKIMKRSKERKRGM